MPSEYELVMRSVYLDPMEDSQLRQLAFELDVTKSDLIRSAVGIKLREWLQSNSREQVLNDLQVGQRDRTKGAAAKRAQQDFDGETAAAPVAAAKAKKPRSMPDSGAAAVPAPAPAPAPARAATSAGARR